MEDKELIKRLENNMQMALTSEICDQHEDLKKEIHLMNIDGEMKCPLCERDRLNAESEQIETVKLINALNRQEYNVFAHKSELKDEGLLEVSFGTYEALTEEETTNKQRATEAYQKFQQGERFNVWLTGSPGVGKSHLAMSILRNLNERGNKDKSCLYISVDEMLLKIRDSFNNKESKYTEHYFVDLLSNVDYLVLDDLGAETGGTGTVKKATDFTLRVLYSIGNARQNKSTIITTNLSRIALEGMYDQKLVSRLMKDTYLINFKITSDKRIKNIEF
ncbi:DNA replication protein DnaC [Psychrobacillus insolitus]|uniref:DNA replication protein DnaC n=1 Tax=Psychrobacillus insolitus TaxID=1461 RepID=A0A2W7N7B8_9BACI|nr:ATP-binding protein [Psychrobacillus insolitus]PZX07933.1 DNA replication protein DnaC [Psychrobacillus insolitus]